MFINKVFLIALTQYMISLSANVERQCSTDYMCVPLSECQEIFNIVEDDTYISYAKSLLCGYSHEPYVCCYRNCLTPIGSYGRTTILDNCPYLKENLYSEDRKKRKFLEDSYVNDTFVCCNRNETNYRLVPPAPDSKIKETLNLSCVTPNGDEGECRYVSECPIFQNILLGTNQEVGYLNDSLCGWWREPMVCCGKTSQYEERYEYLLPNISTCGLWSDYIWSPPWTALIKKGGTDTICLGALINSNYVLTNAKCVEKSLDMTVTLASCLYSDDNQNCKYSVIESKIFPVHNYFPADDTGIALLKLNNSSTNFTPVCLPHHDLGENEVLHIVGKRYYFEGNWRSHNIQFEAILNDECYDEAHSYLNRIICLKNNTICSMFRNSTLNYFILREDKKQWYLEGLFYAENCYGTLQNYLNALYVYEFRKWITSNLK